MMNNNRKIYEKEERHRQINPLQLQKRTSIEPLDHNLNQTSSIYLDDFDRAQIKKQKLNDEYNQDQPSLMENQPECQSDRLTNNYQLKEYDARNIRYCGEDYSFLSNLLLSRFSKQDSALEISKHYPLFQILRAIVKKFMLNELEIIFYLHMIEETKWNYKDNLIKDFLIHFNLDFLPVVASEVKNEEEYSRLLVYLVFCAYTMKNYLNENTDVSLINAHIQSFMKIDVFQKQIEIWKSKNMQGSIKIGPRILNRFFNKLARQPKDNRQVTEDYNALVDSIIQISPPYNNDKQPKQEQNISQEKPSIQPQSYQPLQTMQSFNSNYNMLAPNASIFNNTNSGIFKTPMYFPANEDQFMERSNINDEMQQSMFLNNSILNHPLNSPNHASKMKIKQEDKRQELIQRSIKEEDGSDQPLTNQPPLSMQRGVSTNYLKE